ncbi:Chromo domain-containing protein [Aphis craccivora]|uniref:Chromo domain-containing protein n=1 Tax=Aphis craccivora TaxID=307492 RepID=A0A6G0Y718_APHCR|nr:Chromo domain-containing protein [Aphis craccivora]
MTPVQADLNPTSVTLKQREINNEKIKFKVDDNVRISTQKGVFTKGYLPNWSTEIFEIIKINKTLPPSLISYKIIQVNRLPVVFTRLKYIKLITQTNI